MAIKRTTLKIESKGGEKVAADLKRIGAVGETTGKKIQKGGATANKSLKALDTTVGRVRQNLRRFGETLGPVGVGLNKFGAAGLVAAGGLAAVSVSLGKIVKVGEEAERQQFKIASLLETTGQSSGQTAELIDEIAISIGDLTLASTNGVREAAAALLTFKSVSGDAFERTLRVSQDLAAVMGTDLRSSVLRLGKALEDPVRNLSQLNRAGISFSQNQINVIKSLSETGREAESLSLILDQIEGQVGGAGTAEAQGIAGGFDSISESVRLFIEKVGKGTGILKAFSGTLKSLAEGTKAISESLFPDIDIKRIDALQKVLDATKKLQGGSDIASKRTQVNLANAKGELAAIDKLRNARNLEREEAEENARIQAQLREDQRLSAESEAEAAKIRATQERARLAVAKKVATERRKSLTDIARLEEKASRAGLSGLELLEVERDKSLSLYTARLNKQLISEKEFAKAKLAIEKTFQVESAELAEKAAEKTTADLASQGEEQANVFTTPFSNAAQNIQREFGDTFTDIYRNGTASFEDLSDAVKDIMARLAGEITALMVFRPSLLTSGLGGLGLFGSSGASATAGTAGGALAGGAAAGMVNVPGLGPLSVASLQTTALGIGAGIAGNYVGQQFASVIGLNSNRAGNVGGTLGAGAGFVLGGPLGALAGGFGGNLIGSFLGNGFGFGGNNNQKFGFGTGAAGLQTPFGGLSVTANQDVNATAIVASLKGIDESIAALLSEGQIQRVKTGLAGTGQFFDVKSFDNESFDVVKTRLVRIIDAVSENTVASGLLNSIGRDPGNIDQLVTQAQKIVQMITAFQDESGELNAAGQALKDLNEQFDALGKTADQLGFSLDAIESKRQQAIEGLTSDFNDSVSEQILAIIDPITFALESIENAAADRLENARTLGADLVEVERLNALERSRVIEQAFGGANTTIENFLQSLNITGAGGLSIGQQTSNAEGLFGSLLGSARTDPGARQELAALLPTLVGLKREQLGSTAEFFEFTSFLDSTLRNLVSQKDTVSTLEDIGSAITSGDNAVIEALHATNARLVGEIAELRSDINLLLNAPQAA